MEREVWSVLSAAIFDVQRSHASGPRFTHSIALIVRVYLWSVLHDRAIYWATDPLNWPAASRPKQLPSQSTMSRRLRSSEFFAFLEALSRRLAGTGDGGLLKIVDGKALLVGTHSTDTHATWGYAARTYARGYRLALLWAEGPMPVAWDVQPLNQSEITMAKSLLPHLRGGGYVLGDRFFDANSLYDLAAQANHQFLAQRKKPRAGLGKRRHSPHRLRAIELLRSRFGKDLYRLRHRIEGRIGDLCNFGGGLNARLPYWVRGLRKVHLWVHAKLLINAARIRSIDQRRAA